MVALNVKGTCLFLRFCGQTLQSQNTVILDHHYYSQHKILMILFQDVDLYRLL